MAWRWDSDGIVLILMIMEKLRWIWAIAALALLSSCSIEKQLGKQFVAQSQGTRVAVYFPENALAKNQYSAEYESYSKVLDGFNQDLFLDVMYNAFAKTLADYDVEVYLPEDPENILVDSVNWLVILSNVEVTGSILRYEDILFDEEDRMVKPYALNNVNVASWFELNDGAWLPMQFAEVNFRDGFRSCVDGPLFSSNYSYEIDTLRLDDVYNGAVYLGKLYAGYVYDCFMNHYVVRKMEGLSSLWGNYLRYDPKKKSLRWLSSDKDERFVEMEAAE